jgi:hypothetical protein
MLGERKVRRMVVPAGLAADWLPGGVEFVVDEGLSATELDAVDGVMTGGAFGYSRYRDDWDQGSARTAIFGCDSGWVKPRGKYL